MGNLSVVPLSFRRCLRVCEDVASPSLTTAWNEILCWCRQWGNASWGRHRWAAGGSQLSRWFHVGSYSGRHRWHRARLLHALRHLLASCESAWLSATHHLYARGRNWLIIACGGVDDCWRTSTASWLESSQQTTRITKRVRSKVPMGSVRG